MDYKDSDTAKGVRMLRALRTLHDELSGENNPAVEAVMQLIELPFDSHVRLAKSFEAATA